MHLMGIARVLCMLLWPICRHNLATHDTLSSGKTVLVIYNNNDDAMISPGNMATDKVSIVWLWSHYEGRTYRYTQLDTCTFPVTSWRIVLYDAHTNMIDQSGNTSFTATGCRVIWRLLQHDKWRRVLLYTNRRHCHVLRLTVIHRVRFRLVC